MQGFYSQNALNGMVIPTAKYKMWLNSGQVTNWFQVISFNTVSKNNTLSPHLVKMNSWKFF